jgi:DNA-3-methyladenine glycosylase
MSRNCLPLTYYQHDDVLFLAEDLLGKILITQDRGIITAGRIVETEAYRGADDAACHAFQRRTPRTEIFYQAGGRAYVYLSYGIHHLFNIITGKAGEANAVLIRALEPLQGIEKMQERRKITDPYRLCNGPGCLTIALGIDLQDNGLSLVSNRLWLKEDAQSIYPVVRTTRIGLSKKNPASLLPWRFCLAKSPYLSRSCS